MFYVSPFVSEFDELFDSFTKETIKQSSNFPPYNIATVKRGDTVLGLIEVACTGISKENIDVYFDEENLLTIEAKHQKLPENVEIDYSHKGLSTKDFTRKFRLGKHYEVKEVIYKDGLLRVFLEENKPIPQKIPINTGKSKSILAA